MIEAKIICDSVNPAGVRLTTYVCKYPRFIHSEVMTHRALSKNASSSRAIPVHKMIDSIRRETAMPIHWGKNQSGMQASEVLGDLEVGMCQQNWIAAREAAVEATNALITLGLHKQVANRLLEPFAHMTTLISGTEWANFFGLRVHPDAQPEFQHLAYLMLKEYVKSQPDYIQEGQWHLPFRDKYLDEQLDKGLPDSTMIRACIGRCARVSYKTQDGEYSLDDDLRLFDRLANHRPLHATPMEHVAEARSDTTFGANSSELSNFRGWIQYRKTLKDENIIQMDFAKHLIEYEQETGRI